MKKLLTGLLSAAMVFTLAGCGSSKDHLATIQDKGEITIGLEAIGNHSLIMIRMINWWVLMWKLPKILPRN